MDCSSLADAVGRFIETHRHEAPPSAVVDVAMGMMRLSAEVRRAAIAELCSALPAPLVPVAAERLGSGPILDAATLAVRLCGADGARRCFPMEG